MAQILSMTPHDLLQGRMVRLSPGGWLARWAGVWVGGTKEALLLALVSVVLGSSLSGGQERRLALQAKRAFLREGIFSSLCL